MKANYCGLLLLVVGLVIGWFVGSGATDNAAPAQPGVSPPRFQISAWGTALPRNLAAPPEHYRGCYIIDTLTGEAWHAYGDGPPKKIWSKVR